jgi:hypothetical protein
MVLGASLGSKKNKNKNKDSSDSLRKSHQKTYLLDPGSGKKFILVPDPGSKKAPDPDPQQCTTNLNVISHSAITSLGVRASLAPASKKSFT